MAKEPSISGEVSEELLRQVSLQAALLAGFAFNGLVSLSSTIYGHPYLERAFVICAALVISLEIGALFVAGVLLFTGKSINLFNVKFSSFVAGIWLVYLFGLLFFIADLALLVWIKFRPVAAPVTVICVAASVFMLASLKKIVNKAGW